MKTDWRWVGAFVGVGIALAGYWRWRAAPEPVPEAGEEAAGPVAHSLPAHSAADSAPTSSRRIAASAPAEPSPIEAETEPAAAKAVVSGRVLSDGGTSLIGARITLLQGTSALATSDSGEAGRYELALPDLPCGTVELRCEAPGHRDEAVENAVVPGHYDFALQPAGHSVYGSVVGNRFDEPVAGAAVWLWEGQGNAVIVREVTDEHGRFAITRLRTGLFKLSAAAAGFVPVFTGLLVTEGEAEREVTIRLGWPEELVQVQVIDGSTSMPVKDALVTARLGESYRTDAGGAFQHPVQSKAAMLSVTAEGFCQQQYLLRPGDPAPLIELEPAALFGLRLLVPATLRPIEVRLTQPHPQGLPAREVRCSLQPGTAGEVVALATGLSASLEVMAIVQGPRIATTTCAAGSCPDPERHGTLPLCVLVEGETLRGSVRDAAGRPVASSIVAVFGSGGFEERSRFLSPSRAVLRSCERRVTTDSTGAFTVRGLPAGPLDLAVGSPGFAVTVLPVHVPLEKQIEVVLLPRDGEPGPLTGRFLGADDKPLSEAIVRAIDPDGYVGEVLSNADGRFTFPRLQPGTYKLGVSVLGSTEARSWTCKQLFQPGEENIVLRAPWTVP